MLVVIQSSGISKYTVSLHRRPMALHWLPARHIAVRWLPALHIDLHWLPTTRFFISRAPNMVTRLEVELQPLFWLPGLVHYTGSHNSVLHIKNSRLEVDLQPQALQWIPQLGSSSQELHIGSRIATPTVAPCTTFTGFFSGSTSRVSIKVFLRIKQLFVFQTVYVSKRLLLHNAG